jgi:4-hydroxybenzoate polyprenyltransferase
MLERIPKFLVYSSLFIGSMPAFIIFFSTILLGIHAGIEIYLAAFFMFFSTYSINKLIEVNADFGHEERVQFIKKNFKFVLWASAIFYAIGFLLITKSRPDLILFSLIPLLFVTFYTFKFLPQNFRFRRIKDVTIGKNISVALVWVAFGVLLPTFFSSGVSHLALFSVSLFVFIRLFIGTVIFDMADYNEDKRNKVMTIPVVFGYRATKILLWGLNTALGIFLIFAVFAGWLGPIAHFTNIVTLYTFLYMYLLDKRPQDKRAINDLMVDGEYLVIALSVFLGTLILA